MIIPNKFTNPDLSILRVSALVLAKLIKKKILKFSDILNFLNWELKIDATDILIQSMSFLYIIGKIDYKMETDTVFLLTN
jgi:hypothetical protein